MRTWLCLSISVLLLPLFPAAGIVGLLVVLIKVWHGHYRQIIAERLNQGWVILAGLLIISSAFAARPQESWLGLANFLPFFALFMALRVLIRKPVQLRQLSWLLIFPSLPIVMLGFGQLYAAWETPAIIESILGWKLVSQGVPQGRMSAVFINSNFLAIYLTIAFALTLGLWLEIWQSWQQKSTTKHAYVVLALLSLILLFDFGGLVLTSSRNAWGLSLIILVAYAIYLGWRYCLWIAGIATTVILWIFFAPNSDSTQLRQIVPAFIWLRLSSQSYSSVSIEKLRLTQWQFCWDLIEQRPLLGWGLRNFSPIYQSKTNFWLGHPHNLFLMLGAETGIISTLLLMAIVGSIMTQATILFINWSDSNFKPIFFSYLVAFASCILFNLTDVSIFDLRVNTTIWILLSAISGVVAESTKPS
ncbi:O-antigen ligase family protein [Pleurocapsales cyanobacterium LEGE 10410]|nr:O-antigen ligase family protein [Pleurocapsales cyanobacterium LEGE 10410]